MSGDEQSPGDELSGSFRAQLNRAFDEKSRTGRPLSNAAVAEWLSGHGYAVTGAAIGQLRRGITKPSLRMIEGLARFFDIDPARLVSSTDLDILAAQALGDDQARIMLRSRGLTPSSILAIQALMDQLRANEGLPPIDESDK